MWLLDKMIGSKHKCPYCGHPLSDHVGMGSARICMKCTEIFKERFEKTGEINTKGLSCVDWNTVRYYEAQRFNKKSAWRFGIAKK